MERVYALINKLQEQSATQASAADLLNTVQQLQAELIHAITAPLTTTPPRSAGSSKIAVVMPGAGYTAAGYSNGYSGNGDNTGGYSNGNGSQRPAYSQPVQPLKEAPRAEVPPPPPPPVQPAPVIQKEAPVRQETPARQDEPRGWSIDPLREVPTLAQQESVKELNDIIGKPHTSLNDRLKSSQTELGDVLTEAPVRDLKKAIGLNDRYVFVNELFRGDEAMYERSLKTINAFRILPEAEYWMERELKVKLGWDDGKTTTQHFYQLVKRRFS